jgi:hypothetical protein
MMKGSCFAVVQVAPFGSTLILRLAPTKHRVLIVRLRFQEWDFTIYPSVAYALTFFAYNQKERDDCPTSTYLDTIAPPGVVHGTDLIG